MSSRDFPAASAPVREKMPDYIRYWSKRQPARAATSFHGAALTYADLDAQVQQLAARLVARGIRKGDRIGVLSAPCPEFLISFLAAIDIGAVWVGLNPAYQAAELAVIVTKVRPKLLLCSETHPTRDLPALMAAAVGNAGCSCEVVLFAPGRTIGDRWTGGSAAAALDERAYKAARALVAAEDPALVVYTSGSSGTPKGAILSQRSLGLGAWSQIEQLGWVQPTVICNFPINHVAAVADVCCTALVSGGTIIFQETFEPAAVLNAIEQEGVTVLGGVPTMLHMLLAEPDFATRDLSSLQTIVWAGASISLTTVEVLAALGIPMRTAYGMTETAAHVTFTRPDASIETLATTIGRPYAPCEIRIVDGEGRVCGSGEAGELHIRAPFLMLGYEAGGGDLDRSAFTAEGFLKTGDIGRWTAEGDIRLEGRLSEMIKSGGYRIHATEIEAAIAAHPGVAACAVIGVPDPLYQEALIAFVEGRPGCMVDEDGLRSFCRERLAGFKVPKHFILRDELPRLAVGKIDKERLKAGWNRPRSSR